jgi:hypothetical protein
MNDESTGPSLSSGRGVVAGRRRLVATFATLGGAVLAARSTHPVAGKKRRCKKRKCSPPPNCDGVCGPGCKGCLHRRQGAPLCANGAVFSSMPCLPCVSDNDCVGTDFPYCVSGGTDLTTGQPLAVAVCTGSSPGICTMPSPC